jgi:hypothetical protein
MEIIQGVNMKKVGWIKTATALCSTGVVLITFSSAFAEQASSTGTEGSFEFEVSFTESYKALDDLSAYTLVLGQYDFKVMANVPVGAPVIRDNTRTYLPDAEGKYALVALEKDSDGRAQLELREGDWSSDGKTAKDSSRYSCYATFLSGNWQTYEKGEPTDLQIAEEDRENCAKLALEALLQVKEFNEMQKAYLDRIDSYYQQESQEATWVPSYQLERSVFHFFTNDEGERCLKVTTSSPTIYRLSRE